MATTGEASFNKMVKRATNGGGVAASAANDHPAPSTPVTPSAGPPVGSSSTVFTRIPPRRPPGGTGGSGSGGGNGSGGGGNSGGSGSGSGAHPSREWDWSGWKNILTRPSGIVGLLVGFASIWWYLKDTPPVRGQIETRFLEVQASAEKVKEVEASAKLAEQQARQMAIAARSGATVQPPWSSGVAVAAPAVPAQAVQTEQENVLRTFTCRTLDEKLAVFAKRDVQILDRPGTYRIGPGCAVMKITRDITSVQGRMAYFQEPGDGSHVGVEHAALGFLRAREGYELQVTVFSDGLIIIN